MQPHQPLPSAPPTAEQPSSPERLPRRPLPRCAVVSFSRDAATNSITVSPRATANTSALAAHIVSPRARTGETPAFVLEETSFRDLAAFVAEDDDDAAAAAATATEGHAAKADGAVPEKAQAETAHAARVASTSTISVSSDGSAGKGAPGGGVTHAATRRATRAPGSSDLEVELGFDEDDDSIFGTRSVGYPFSLRSYVGTEEKQSSYAVASSSPVSVNSPRPSFTGTYGPGDELAEEPESTFVGQRYVDDFDSMRGSFFSLATPSAFRLTGGGGYGRRSGHAKDDPESAKSTALLRMLRPRRGDGSIMCIAARAEEDARCGSGTGATSCGMGTAEGTGGKATGRVGRSMSRLFGKWSVSSWGRRGAADSGPNPRASDGIASRGRGRGGEAAGYRRKNLDGMTGTFKDTEGVGKALNAAKDMHNLEAASEICRAYLSSTQCDRRASVL